MDLTMPHLNEKFFLDEIFCFMYETLFPNMTNSFLRAFVAFSLTCNSILFQELRDNIKVPMSRTEKSEENWSCHLHLFYFALSSSCELIRGEQSSPLTQPLLSPNHCISKKSAFYHRTTTCTSTVKESKHVLLKRMKLGYPRGQWTESGAVTWVKCEEGRQNHQKELPESLGDLWKWWTNPISHTEVCPRVQDTWTTDTSICEKIPVLGHLTEEQEKAKRWLHLTSGASVAGASWDCQLEHLYTLAPQHGSLSVDDLFTWQLRALRESSAKESFSKAARLFLT